MIGLLIAASTAVGFETGNSLLSECHQEGPSAVACMGYVAGVADAMSASQAASQTHYFCRPLEATVGQLRDVVVQSLTSNPQTRHLNAADLSMSALIAAFPCPK